MWWAVVEPKKEKEQNMTFHKSLCLLFTCISAQGAGKLIHFLIKKLFTSKKQPVFWSVIVNSFSTENIETVK